MQERRRPHPQKLKLPPPAARRRQVAAWGEGRGGWKEGAGGGRPSQKERWRVPQPPNRSEIGDLGEIAGDSHSEEAADPPAAAGLAAPAAAGVGGRGASPWLARSPLRMFVVLSAGTGLWAGSFDEASGEDDAVVGVSVVAVALARWNFAAAVDQSSDEQTSHMRSLARNFVKKAGTRIVGFIEYPIQLVARLRDPHPSPPGFASDIIRALAGQTVLIKASYSDDEVASTDGEVTTR